MTSITTVEGENGPYSEPSLNDLKNLLESAKNVENDNLSRLRDIAENGELPSSVTPEKVQAYLNALLGEEDCPVGAVAMALTVMGLNFRGLEGREGEPVIRGVVKNVKVQSLYPGEEVFWSDILIEDFWNTSRFFYQNTKKTDDLTSENIRSFMQAVPTDFRWKKGYIDHIAKDIDRLIALGFIPPAEFIAAICEDSNEESIHQLMFALKNPFSKTKKRQENPAYRLRKLSGLYARANASGAREEILESLSFMSTGFYRSTIRDLLTVAHGEDTVFGAFGRDNAQSLLDVLECDDSADIESLTEGVWRLERHWRGLRKAWAEVSALPLNLPVLEHRGLALDKYGELNRDFVNRMFLKRDTSTNAYSDEERQIYTDLMCREIKGGMSMTGIDRIEWDFWRKVMTRIQNDNISDIVHVDCGGSTGFVTRQLWTDKRTRGADLSGRLKRVINMDLIPEEDTLDRIYEFNPDHYDRTERLLTMDEAREAYLKAITDFDQAHPSANYQSVSADTASHQLPIKIKELEGKVHLVTNMRAQFLHGGSDDKRKAHELHLRLTEGNENARIYEQRGLATYGDLILGILYRVVKGKLEIEALQINKDGKSITLWRLDKNGRKNESWEADLRKIFQK